MLPLLFNSADGDKLTKEYFVLRFDDGSEAFDPKLDWYFGNVAISWLPKTTLESLSYSKNYFFFLMKSYFVVQSIFDLLLFWFKSWIFRSTMFTFSDCLSNHYYSSYLIYFTICFFFYFLWFFGIKPFIAIISS